MKVRIGVGAGGAGLDGQALAELAVGIEECGLDSLWLPEILTAEGPDPLVALAFAAAAAPSTTLGTTMLLPGRNPLRLAKAVATLDHLSDGRFLVTFVPGLARGPERDAVGLAPSQRIAAMEEAMPVLRALWAGATVTHHGRFLDIEGASVAPVPAQDPFEVWSGGMRRSSLIMCGHFFDGWLPALCTPDEAAEGRAVIDRAAEEVGRSISSEHFGVSLLWSPAEPPGRLADVLRGRAGRDPTEVLPVGADALRRRVEQFIAVGFSKFVVRSLEPPGSWRRTLEQVSETLGDLQS